MNKINQLWIICSSFLILGPINIMAQHTTNKYGLAIINNTMQLQKSVEKVPEKELIDVKKKIPSIVLDLRYASKNNFTHQQLYSTSVTTYLRKPAAESLEIVQTELNKKGLGLKIFDAYRPYRATEKMWELVKDERYAANPKNGSGHNRGIAVDLTIIDLKTNKELNMGTSFDNFTDTAHHTFTNLPKEVLQNRLMIKNLMEKAGFKSLETEWWHYMLPDSKNYEILDIDFKELKNGLKKSKIKMAGMFQ